MRVSTDAVVSRMTERLASEAVSVVVVSSFTNTEDSDFVALVSPS